jgi:RNA polymerase sigma-70 factor (ECF subfamily)
VSHPSDADLVRAVQNGDRRALDTLLERHYDRIRAVCVRLTGNRADADDATQEALLAVVRGIGRFDGRAAFTTWLYRVATNAALDELRRRRRRPRPDDGVAEIVDAVPAGGPTTSPSEAVVERTRLTEALAALPLEFRTAVVLRDVADLEYAEIAAVLDVPVGTVRSRIARGRAALADALREPGNRSSLAQRRNERP